MLRNCPVCGRLLTLPAGTPCPFCLAEEDAAIERIRRHVEAGRPASLAAISRELGLRTALLRRLQASGRIQLAGEQRCCHLCGTPLDSGEVCPDCLRKFGGGRTPPRAAPPAPAPGPRGPGGPWRLYGRSGPAGGG